MEETNTVLEAANTFEEKLEKTKAILEKLSNNELPLDEGLKLYKEGMAELTQAAKMLEDAKLEFETIENSPNDAPDA
jgi:exodeoxyribonuclease VII small subunit